MQPLRCEKKSLRQAPGTNTTVGFVAMLLLAAAICPSVKKIVGFLARGRRR